MCNVIALTMLAPVGTICTTLVTHGSMGTIVRTTLQACQSYARVVQELDVRFDLDT